jgi:hypothetical protein
MFEQSLIRASGQWWKALTGFWGVVGSGAIIFIGKALMKTSLNVGVLLVLAGVLLGAASFIFGVVSIRCPGCRARWFWIAVSTQPHSDWLAWLLTSRECSRCGYGAGLTS